MHQTHKLTPTKSQRAEYRPQTAGNTRHATAIGTVAMPDVASAGYLSQCVAIVHFGIVDLHSLLTMVTNCPVKSKYTTKRTHSGAQGAAVHAGNHAPVAVVIFVAFKVRNKLRNPFGLR